MVACGSVGGCLWSGGWLRGGWLQVVELGTAVAHLVPYSGTLHSFKEMWFGNQCWVFDVRCLVFFLCFHIGFLVYQVGFQLITLIKRICQSENS